MDVTREQVIAYRVAAQGLHRDRNQLSDLPVLDLGVQEAMGHPAALAFAARLPSDTPLAPGDLLIGPGHRLALAWTLRGAPHVHRRKDLNALAGALWPLSEADAAGRLNETGPSVRRAGITALEQLQAAVDALRAVVTAPMAKGAASTEATRRIPPPMRRDCRACRTRHISDSAMRVAAPAAGLELEPDTAPPVLVPRRGAKRVTATDHTALVALARAYLTLLGPADVGEFAGYLQSRRADVSTAWPDDLEPVSIGGRRAWLPAGQLDALTDSPPPDVVRLLGPFDPYLQARDRELIVPDKSLYKTLWPVLGRPGVLFVDGEVAGIWRTKSSGSKLTITAESFGPLSAPVWEQVEAEAQRVCQARGGTSVQLKRVG